VIQVNITLSGLKDMLQKIEQLGTRKNEVERFLNSKIFHKSFMECFDVGAFSTEVRCLDRTMNYEVGTEPVENSEWRIYFKIATAAAGPSSSPRTPAVWRRATVAEIISNWGSYAPILANLIRIDNVNLATVEAAVSNLRDMLAPDLLTKYLE
jgi:hypothetical protein